MRPRRSCASGHGGIRPHPRDNAASTTAANRHADRVHLVERLPSVAVAHPIMFDDDDPFLARVRTIALAFPKSAEKISHGRPVFFTNKIFTYFSGSVRVGEDWVQHPHAVLVQPDPIERAALIEDDRFFKPAYLAPAGWLGIDLDAQTDWDEIAELIDASYRLTAPKRAIAALDAQQ